VEFNFVEWKFLAEKSQGSLRTIQLQQTCRLIDSVFESLNGGSSVRNLKLKTDYSEEVAKAMIEQCFYEDIKQNKNNPKIGLSVSKMIAKCEQFHHANHIASWASWSSWVKIKKQITRIIHGYIDESNNVHWFKDTPPTPALTEWMENLDVSLSDENKKLNKKSTKENAKQNVEKDLNRTIPSNEIKLTMNQTPSILKIKQKKTKFHIKSKRRNNK